MIPVAIGRRALVLALLLGASPAWAQVALTHRETLYADAKGVALKAPDGVACNDSLLVVADSGNARLVRFEMGASGISPGVEVKISQVTSPADVQLGPDGAVFVLDRRAGRVARVGAGGAFEAWVDAKDDSGAAVAGAFKVDSAGTVWILDVAGRRVLAVDRSGAVTRKVDLPKERGKVFTDIAVDAAGTLYAAEALSATIWSADKSAAAMKPLSKSLKEFMTFPAHLSVDRGTLLVVDRYGHGVVAVGIDGSYQGRQLGMGWGDGFVYYPGQLCVAAKTAFVADRYNNRVQAFAMGK